MNLIKSAKKFWAFLKKDTWQSWLVSLVLIFIFIKIIFFPLLSLITSSPLPLVVVESCSMYHEAPFESWWQSNAPFYESHEIEKSDFLSFPFKSGLNKGDIIFVWGRSSYKKGDIIIFEAGARNPLIHRIIATSPFSTKGDHNTDQLPIETSIQEDSIIGKSAARVPLLGWLKLIFFEPFRSPQERGFCK